MQRWEFCERRSISRWALLFSKWSGQVRRCRKFWLLYYSTFHEAGWAFFCSDKNVTLARFCH